MFDPFGDYATAGYLRNVRGDKDENVVKHFEHNLFRANLQDAVQFLASRKVLAYADFLEVHRILFSVYYPWAGQDRATTAPNSAVTKGGIAFCHPRDCRRAVEAGLRLGQDKTAMNAKPGEVMGLFAYGHPFLDGNGRTMLLAHIELAYRAGFSIAWERTNKADYLNALSQEIMSPGRGTLDAYLLQFKGPRLERKEWGVAILEMRGLDGLDEANQVDGDFTDPAVAERYLEFERKRDYSYSVAERGPLAEQWGAVQAVGRQSGTVEAMSETEVIQHVGRDKYVVWERQRLSGADLEVGQHVEISADGKVQEPPERDSGLSM